MTRNNSEVALEQDKTQDKRTGRLRIGSSNVAFYFSVCKLDADCDRVFTPNAEHIFATP